MFEAVGSNACIGFFEALLLDSLKHFYVCIHPVKAGTASKAKQ
jgi:hypothetical protein